MSVRAKFKVSDVEDTNGNPVDGKTIRLYAVSGGSPENEEFFKFTPAGEITLQTVNPAAAEQFEVGKEFYIDFTPAE